MHFVNSISEDAREFFPFIFLALGEWQKRGKGKTQWFKTQIRNKLKSNHIISE